MKLFQIILQNLIQRDQQNRSSTVYPACRYSLQCQSLRPIFGSIFIIFITPSR